jgi:hypothetical protein
MIQALPRILGLLLVTAWILGGSTPGQPADPQATAKTPGATATPAKPGESLVFRLARIGVKAEITPQKELLIKEGFPFTNDIEAKDVIEIVDVEGGIFTAAETSAVPTEMGGMAYLVAGGSFMAQLNAREGTRTLADCLGNTWIFQKPGLQFDVYLTGSNVPAYNVQSKAPGATIRFTREGVYLKGFTVKVLPRKVD